MPALVSFSPSPKSAGGRPSSLHELGVSKTWNGLKHRKPAITRKKKRTVKVFNVEGLELGYNYIIPVTSIMDMTCVKV